MEFLGQAFLVFAILVAVAVAAVAFEPADPLETWKRLAERYRTGSAPRNIQYPGTRVLFGGRRGALKPLAPSATFDVAIDNHGLWLVCRGADVGDASTLSIPGTHVRPASKPGRKYLFELFAEPPVRIAVADGPGKELLEKCQPRY